MKALLGEIYFVTDDEVWGEHEGPCAIVHGPVQEVEVEDEEDADRMMWAQKNSYVIPELYKHPIHFTDSATVLPRNQTVQAQGADFRESSGAEGEGFEPSAQNSRGFPSVPVTSGTEGLSAPLIPAKARDSVMDSAMTACDVKMLDISTRHITEPVSRWIADDLANQQGILCGTTWNEYGWILYVNPANPVLDASIPRCLADLFDFARSRGYLYLKLDCDSDALPEGTGLPSFEW